MKFKAIIFDLDGTLLDTIEDLASCMNAAMKQYGFPARSIDEYRAFVGDGLSVLAKRVLPEASRDSEMIERCVIAMRKEYQNRWTEKTRPYPGTVELLQLLNKKGIACAVLSNKLHEFTETMVHHFFGKETFTTIIGAGLYPLKPDPSSALAIAKECGALPSEVLYIGDSDVDMETAVRAGMYPLGVLWGFRSKEQLLNAGAKALIARPIEIITILH